MTTPSFIPPTDVLLQKDTALIDKWSMLTPLARKLLKINNIVTFADFRKWTNKRIDAELLGVSRRAAKISEKDVVKTARKTISEKELPDIKLKSDDEKPNGEQPPTTPVA